MEEKQHLYMKRYRKDYAVIIQYHWGKYHVSRLSKTDRGLATIVIRQYKTLNGAERYLLHHAETGIDSMLTPELFYGTEQFIKEGKYWKE